MCQQLPQQQAGSHSSAQKNRPLPMTLICVGKKLSQGSGQQIIYAIGYLVLFRPSGQQPLSRALSTGKEQWIPLTEEGMRISFFTACRAIASR